MRSPGIVLVVLAVVLAFPALPVVGQNPNEKVDLDAIYKIKDEGLNRSQVMTTVSYLTDVYGARLTGSLEVRKSFAQAVSSVPFRR